MVKLRLRRIGKKKYPVYKLVVADGRSPRDGRYIEALGNYDPKGTPTLLDFKEERVYYWLRKGAQPTNTVRSLLRRNGAWLRWSLMKRGADDSQINSVMERWRMAQDDRAGREADRKARRMERRKKAAAPAEKTPAEQAPVEPTEQAPEAPAAT